MNDMCEHGWPKPGGCKLCMIKQEASDSAKMWDRRKREMEEPSIFEEILMVSELRRSCGVEPSEAKGTKIKFKEVADEWREIWK